MDEAELVRRAQAGDERCFERLLAPQRPTLAAFVSGRVPPALKRKIAPEDVVQDASITAYARLDRFEYRGEGSFRAWLWQITQHKLQEAVRRFAGTAKRGAAAEVSRGGRADTHQFAAAQGTPSEYAMAEELEAGVRDAMARLPEDYRHVLTLVRIEQQSLREAALSLDRGYEATKKLYGRAVTALARELARGADPRT
jgi:RNA polymerase sigma factor (sigma-70 family)